MHLCDAPVGKLLLRHLDYPKPTDSATIQWNCQDVIASYGRSCPMAMLAGAFRLGEVLAANPFRCVWSGIESNGIRLFSL